MGDGGHHFSLTTFAPNGKLSQIDHALRRVEQGSPVIGIKAKNGVALAAEKKIASPLVDPSTIPRLCILCSNSGCAEAGMPSDFRLLLRAGRKEAAIGLLTYGEPPSIKAQVREMASIAQEYTHSGGVRPFGVSVLVAGFDHEGPHLYQVDPSGSYYPWLAAAIGRNMVNANTFLEKRYNPDLELEDAIHVAILTLKESFEGAITPDNIELGVVDASQQFRLLDRTTIADYLSEID